MTETERTTKPAGATGPTHKGAAPNAQMGAANSPTGPNETEEGIIKQPAPEGPGPDQIGLVGGDPTESIQSTPPLEEEAPAAAKHAGAAGKDKQPDARR